MKTKQKIKYITKFENAYAKIADTVISWFFVVRGNNHGNK